MSTSDSDDADYYADDPLEVPAARARRPSVHSPSLQGHPRRQACAPSSGRLRTDRRHRHCPRRGGRRRRVHRRGHPPAGGRGRAGEARTLRRLESRRPPRVGEAGRPAAHRGQRAVPVRLRRAKDAGGPRAHARGGGRQGGVVCRRAEGQRGARGHFRPVRRRGRELLRRQVRPSGRRQRPAEGVHRLAEPHASEGGGGGEEGVHAKPRCRRIPDQLHLWRRVFCQDPARRPRHQQHADGDLQRRHPRTPNEPAVGSGAVQPAARDEQEDVRHQGLDAAERRRQPGLVQRGQRPDVLRARRVPGHKGGAHLERVLCACMAHSSHPSITAMGSVPSGIVFEQAHGR